MIKLKINYVSRKTECYRVATIQFLKTFCGGIVAPSETKGKMRVDEDVEVKFGTHVECGTITVQQLG